MNYIKNYFFISLIFISLLIFLSVTLVGCSNTTNNVVVTDSSPSAKYYSIVSSVDFNESLCSSIGYGNSENGFSHGLSIIIKDKETDALLKGYATYSSPRGSGGIGTDTSYTCEEKLVDGSQMISVYAKGYSPLVFPLSPVENSLMTIEVSMVRSCTGAPSCFDNFEIMNSWIKNSNKTHYDELLAGYEDSFYKYIDTTFGINRTEYTLQCMECDMSRGGYVKAKGTYKDGSDLDLYYHWGWCSSGGTDCGDSLCISTTSENIFNKEKNKICGSLSWNGRHDNNICTAEEFNNDTIIRNECMDGKFESIDSDKWTIALSQSSNRCSSSVSNISLDCIGSN